MGMTWNKEYFLQWGINRRWMKTVGVIAVLYGILFFPNAFECRVDAAMPVPVTNQQSYIAWLESTGRPAYSRYHAYAANYDVYNNYRILSYGTPDMVPGNRYDSLGRQYAIHGFSYDEYTVTNTFFRDDTAGVSDPRNWNNIALGQDAAISWMRLTSREKEHIKNAGLYYSGRDFGGMTYSSLRLTESRCVVIAVPSWNLGFALHTKHYNSKNQIRYGTLNGNGIGGITINGTIEPLTDPVDHVINIPSDQDAIDITFNVQFSVQSYTGLARSTDIGRGGIQFNNKETESQGAGPWSTSQTIHFTRQSLSASKDQSREITLKATIWTVSALGDLVSREISYSFTLIEKSKADLHGVMTMKGAISLFRDKKTAMGYSLANNTKRFLCLERITLRIDFEGAPIPDHVIFYPVGAQSTSASVTKTSNSTGYAQISYPMGILPSSLNWNNIRVRSSYQCSASAFCGDIRTDFALNGIEITGDIYDLVYLQTIPKKSEKYKKG